jgi:hypothetical protein
MSRLSGETCGEYTANNHEIWFGGANYHIVKSLPKELKGSETGPF